MIGRWVPPAHSPIAPLAVLAGGAAAAGLLRADRDAIRAELARTFSARRVVLTDSGTSALVLALRACTARGRAVALPAYGCIDLAAAAEYAGVPVRLYDLDPATLAPDLDSVHTALGRGVGAIVVTPLYGYPVDVAPVIEAARTHGATVIEDAAQGAGGTLGGRRSGSFGDLAVLSFGRGKGTTGGSGGALLIHTATLAGETGLDGIVAGPDADGGRGFGDAVKLAAQWLLARPGLYALPSSIPALKLGEMVYHPAHEPRDISTAAARIVPSAVALDGTEVAHRRARARVLTRCIGPSERIHAVRPAPGAEPGYLRFPVFDVRGTLRPMPRLGVLRGYPVTLDEHPVTRGVLASGERAGTGAQALRDRLFTAPTHSRMAPRDERALEGWLARAARGDEPPVATTRGDAP